MSQLQLRQFPYNFEILRFYRSANYFIVLPNQNVSNNIYYYYNMTLHNLV